MTKHRLELNQKVEETLAKGWKEWSAQAAKLQIFGADAENRKKDSCNFYKMDAESIMTIWEEFSDDFLSVAGEQLTVVRRLVEQLDDDQLGTQLQFERYEWERRQKMASQMTVAIKISDGEQSP